jgi:hypothetical protein
MAAPFTMPLSYPPIRRPSKIGLARICSRQERELIALRSKVGALLAAVAPVPIPTPTPAIEAAEAFRAEVAAAKAKHAEFLAKEAIEAPERDRQLAAWRAEQKAIARDKRVSPEGRAMQAARTRKWRQANPERAKEAALKWRRDNPEKAQEALLKWRLANPERVAERMRKWRQANPEKVKAAEKRRRLKERAKKQIRASLPRPDCRHSERRLTQ